MRMKLTLPRSTFDLPSLRFTNVIDLLKMQIKAKEKASGMQSLIQLISSQSYVQLRLQKQ